MSWKNNPNGRPWEKPWDAKARKKAGLDGVVSGFAPMRKGGLHWWQKAVFAGCVAAVALAGYFGINALRNQEYKPVSTPTLKLRCFFQDFFPVLQRNR